jgi:excisionase family DNA binding protein
VGYDTGMGDYITTPEAARVIGVNGRRVRQLIQEGRLAGKRVGRDWLVERADAERYRDSDRTPGRKPTTAEPQQ